MAERASAPGPGRDRARRGLSVGGRSTFGTPVAILALGQPHVQQPAPPAGPRAQGGVSLGVATAFEELQSLGFGGVLVQRLGFDRPLQR